MQKMKNGEYGEIYMARGLCFKARNTIGKTPVEKVPPGVDYDMWTGPAPLRPFTKNRFHYNWHWFWDLGTGEIGNNGIHGLDLARNVMGRPFVAPPNTPPGSSHASNRSAISPRNGPASPRTWAPSTSCSPPSTTRASRCTIRR